MKALSENWLRCWLPVEPFGDDAGCFTCFARRWGTNLQDKASIDAEKEFLIMIDYNYLIMARKEYEERVHKAEMELLARQSQSQQPGTLSKLLYGLGEWLETMGLRLKEQHQPIPMHHTYHRGHAG
jgi:hypothetical protein